MPSKAPARPEQTSPASLVAGEIKIHLNSKYGLTEFFGTRAQRIRQRTPS